MMTTALRSSLVEDLYALALGTSPNHPGLVVRCFIAAHPPAWDDVPEPMPDWNLLKQPDPDFEPLWDWDQRVSW